MNLTYNAMQEIDEIDCVTIQVNERRWYLVAVAGTSLSLISLICNIIIAKVLLSSKHSHFYFLAILALSDSFLSFMYGPVIAMDIIKDRLQVLWITRAYWSYLGPLLSLCQTSMTFSTYLIILATIERYLITHRSRSLTAFRKSRIMLTILVFLLSLLLRGTAIFEIEVQKNFNCTGLLEYTPGLSDIVQTFWYGTVFRFYTRNIMTVFLPFFLLAYLNYSIVRTLRKQQRSAEMFRFLSSDHKMKIRSATRLMVTIVCSYLVANVLNVLITLWEQIDLESTQQVETYQFYETCTDVISVLYIFVCATRLIVYYSLNKEIREDIQTQLCNFSKRGPPQLSALRRYDDGTGQHIGTEIDAVAIAIARRLMSLDIRIIDPTTSKKEMGYPDSPVQAIIYANKHCRDEAEPV